MEIDSAGQRMLLKISGGALGPDTGTGIEADRVSRICDEIVRGVERVDCELALVVGGGNFLRGRDVKTIDRVTADHMGMLATVLNGLALRSAFDDRGVETVVLSAFDIAGVVEPFDARRARAALSSGKVVILVAGTGRPFFSTDSTATLRALEVKATKLLKGTSVRGVYSADPKTDPAAEYYPEISFKDVLARDLKVVDATAVCLCRDFDLPIEVFDMTEPGNIEKAICGERLGTLIRQ